MRTRLTAVCLAFCVMGVAQDWPQWRGPARDGSTKMMAPAQWPQSLRQVWKVPVGEGHSSPVVSGTRAYQHTRRGESEVVAAYDLATGKLAWKDEYPAPYTMNPAATAHGKGPKSTPVVSGGHLITLGISGILTSYDSQTGKVLWRKDFAKQYKSTSPDFGTAMSPMMDGDRVIAHVGGSDGGALTAFDAATGAVKWAWSGEGPGYASPVAIEVDGTRQIVTQSASQIISVAAASGALLWSMPFKTPWAQNAVTPVPAKGLVIVSGLDNPAIGLRIKSNGGKWVAESVWEAKEAGMYMSSPVPVGGLIFGYTNRNKGQLFGLDPASGKVVWKGPVRQGDNAALIASGDTLLMLTTEASLQVFKASATGLDAVRQYKVADTATWAHPALTSQGILVKDKDTLALWAIR